jgi:hypothetical protein
MTWISMHSDSDTVTSVPDALTTAATVFGLVSLALCWWFPFGPTLGICGTVCGVASWLAGGGGRAVVGGLLAASGAGAGLLLAWDYWARLTGF